MLSAKRFGKQPEMVSLFFNKREETEKLHKKLLRASSSSVAA